MFTTRARSRSWRRRITRWRKVDGRADRRIGRQIDRTLGVFFSLFSPNAEAVCLFVAHSTRFIDCFALLRMVAPSDET